MKNIRKLVFLRDVFSLACSSYGGPQAHLTLFFNILVKKRAYISEEELINLYSFCQILPGPASTQTITAVGFRLGGPQLAFLTLLIWILPATIIMTTAAIILNYLQIKQIPLYFAQFIHPIAIGFVLFAAYRIANIVLKTKLSIALFLLTAVLGYTITSPAIFPVSILLCGTIAALRYDKTENIPHAPKEKFKIDFSNLILFGGIAFGAALLGYLTLNIPESLPINRAIRLFENFFRNGSLVFGGGQSLIAVLHKQFVEFKGYLNNDEFLSGYALLQILPGPIFSFSSYIGALAMRDYGLYGQILGGIIGAVGIFLPGTILIFFVIRFWDQVKNNPVMKASLTGINAASAGILLATVLILTRSVEITPTNILITLGTFGILQFTKIPPPFIIIAGVLGGILF